MLTLIHGGELSMTRVSDEPVANCGLRRRLDCLEVAEGQPPIIELLLPDPEADAFAAGLRARFDAALRRPGLVEVVRDEERSGWAVVSVAFDRMAVSAALIFYGERLAAA